MSRRPVLCFSIADRVPEALNVAFTAERHPVQRAAAEPIDLGFIGLLTLGWGTGADADLLSAGVLLYRGLSLKSFTAVTAAVIAGLYLTGLAGPVVTGIAAVLVLLPALVLVIGPVRRSGRPRRSLGSIQAPL